MRYLIILLFLLCGCSTTKQPVKTRHYWQDPVTKETMGHMCVIDECEKTHKARMRELRTKAK